MMSLSGAIHFYWDGPISDTRLEILRNCVYSTRIFNPDKTIIVWSRSLVQSQFESCFDIKVFPWADDIFIGVPVSPEVITKFRNSDPRSFSDFFRLVLLYQFGGSYIDTDDLCIKKLPEARNIVCRSYDPHTSFYNKIDELGCFPGEFREITGYDRIPFFPRNDCWLNFDQHHYIIKDILQHPALAEEGLVSILASHSFQSLTLEVCKKHIDKCGEDFRFGLTLLYLFEDFVAGSSTWDRCEQGGEMCDIYATLPGIKDYPWGSYKCNEETASEFFKKVTSNYPVLSHLWLHSKDQEKEWFQDIEPLGRYYLSTWIYFTVKNLIEFYTVENA
jgi:hypothetical protein